MSLIDEALKRARQEAARQDASQRYAYPAMPAQVQAPDRSRSMLVVGLIAGLLLGLLAIGGTLWWTGRNRAPQIAAAPDPPPVTAQAPTVPPSTAVDPIPAAPLQAAPDPQPVPEIQRPTAQPTVPAPRTEPREVAPPAQPEPRPVPVPPAAQPASPLPAAPEPGTPAPAAPEPATAPAASEPGINGRTFVRELPVPGGGQIELRGIASGSKPAALLNGRVVAPGEVVEGFTVVAVESRRVELRGYGATVYLSLE